MGYCRSCRSRSSQGARVGVLAIENADGTWEALQILVKPIAPSVAAVSGAVVSREGNVLTIEMPNGEIKEIVLGADQEVPKPGDVITAFAKKSERAGERPTVTGLEKADKVRERIQGFLDQVSQELPDAPPAVADAREAMTERLSNLLERHADTLQRVVDNDRMPEAARERIRTSLESARARIQTAHERIQQARERLGLPERVQPEGTPSADAAGRDAGSGLPAVRR